MSALFLCNYIFVCLTVFFVYQKRLFNTTLFLCNYIFDCLTVFFDEHIFGSLQIGTTVKTEVGLCVAKRLGLSVVDFWLPLIGFGCRFGNLNYVYPPHFNLLDCLFNSNQVVSVN